MNFSSDNWAGAAPQINAALAANAGGFAAAYGDSDLDEAARLSDRRSLRRADWVASLVTI